ncbi:MAG: hypothetical protein JNK05_07895 [Myxococcales bacterium]|nr:hypothetical protein [Myxococcales bacterium]
MRVRFAVWALLATTIAAGVSAIAPAASAQSRRLLIRSNVRDITLRATNGVSLDSRPPRTINGCQLPCAERVRRTGRFWIQGPEIFTSAPFEIPLTATRLDVFATTNAARSAYETRRVVLSALSGLSVTAASVTWVLFFLFNASSPMTLAPGSTQEGLVTASTILTATSALTSLGIVINLGTDPGPTRVYDDRGQLLTNPRRSEW